MSSRAAPSHVVVQPAHFPAARGYANGIVTRGRTLYVAGQVGWELDGTFATDDLADQFARALDHVIDIVRAAGGSPEHIVQMRVYVTDLPAYRNSLKRIGVLWRERLGRHFPVMALVGVNGLVEPRAKVEIEAVAALPDPGEGAGE